MDDDKAFDAVESYLCETDREPSAGWRTVSLVTAMLGILTRGPEFEKPTPEARYEAFKAAADELSERGLDAAALVRYGMLHEATAPLLVALTIPLLFNNDDTVTEGTDVPAWQAVLELERLDPPISGQPTQDDVRRWFDDVVVPVIPRIDQWAVTASLEELVKLTPPTDLSMIPVSVSEPVDRGLREQYRWAVDHFTKTFYRDWKTSSLHYELRWLDGDILPPCPDELMRDRRIPREKITEEIARRTVYKSGSPDPGASLALEMYRHGQKLLKQGRYREAAAVFEFGVQQRPEDNHVRNNLGFCLITVDAHKALEHLKAAANMGYEPSATNAYNQMCCYVILRRSRAALNIADSEWKKPNPRHESAILWRQTSRGTWELFDTDDSFQSIAAFAVEIARNEAWKDQEEFWTERVDQKLEQSAHLRQSQWSRN